MGDHAHCSAVSARREAQHGLKLQDRAASRASPNPPTSPGGQKYIAFHQELLGGLGPASKEKTLAAAKDHGFDMKRLEQDLASDEVGATINEDIKLASAVGITGTPGYVIGKDVVVGAVG